MKIIDLNDIPYSEKEENNVSVIQDWGYTKEGRFYASEFWNVTHNGAFKFISLGGQEAMKKAMGYAEANNVDAIYFCNATKKYYKNG